MSDNYYPESPYEDLDDASMAYDPDYVPPHEWDEAFNRGREEEDNLGHDGPTYNPNQLPDDQIPF